jgi:hypothetical protein
LLDAPRPNPAIGAWALALSHQALAVTQKASGRASPGEEPSSGFSMGLSYSAIFLVLRHAVA